jgi:hypothetical protein
MYTLQIYVTGKIHRVTVKNQKNVKKKRTELEMSFVIADGSIHIDRRRPAVLHVSNRIWNQDNYSTVARSLLSFFISSKFAASTEWTSFWHVKPISEASKVYKMYDCGLDFLEMNVKLHSGKK